VKIVAKDAVGVSREGPVCRADPLAQHADQSVTRAQDLVEKRLFGREVCVERAARQAGGQHYVVDGGRREPPQPKEPGSVVEDVLAGPRRSGGAGGHSTLRFYVI